MLRAEGVGYQGVAGCRSDPFAHPVGEPDAECDTPASGEAHEGLGGCGEPVAEDGEGLILDVGGAPIASAGGVALMGLGAVTHAFDQNQRYVPLDYEMVDEASIRIVPPPTPRDAPPGDYILFLLSDRGVPSVGVSTRLRL